MYIDNSLQSKTIFDICFYGNVLIYRHDNYIIMMGYLIIGNEMSLACGKSLRTWGKYYRNRCT